MRAKSALTNLGAAVLLAFLGMFFGAVNATPASAQGRSAMRAEVVEFRAVVESIDHSTRVVLLRQDDGTLASVKVGPGVRNLPQVKAGDVVVLRYGEALIAQATQRGAGMAQPQGAAIAERAPKGMMPGAAVADTVTARVKITAIDLQRNMVSFTGPQGVAQTVPVRHPEMQRLLRTLKVGDDVDVTFQRALAIRVIRGG